MSNRHITELLAEGKALDTEATAHLAGCESCRRLLAALSENVEPPSAERIKIISAQLTQDWEPVKPLPSNTVLIGIGLSIFCAFSFIVAAAVGLKAIHVLSAGQMVFYYGAVLLLAVLFSRAIVERMIPAAKHLISATLLSLAAIPALAMITFALFQNHRSEDFVSHGMPCLRLGSLSALLIGLLAWKLFRKGYLVSPRAALTLYGLFAGLVAIAVLALHCPILDSLHILVWHLGAMLLAGCAGLALGSSYEKLSHAD